jgi:membrane-associated protease RseP (regulator of RpoE activity)
MINANSLRVTALLALLAVSVNAADNGDTDPATRSQIEDKLHSANDRLNEAAREVSDLSMQLYAEPFMRGGAPRAILGINVGSDNAAEESEHGVRVLSVSPGGPAATAGVKANDIIVSFGGRKLQKAGGKSPRQELLALTRGAEPNTPVALDLERDGKVQTLKVVPKGMRIFMDSAAMQGWEDPGSQFADGDFIKQLESMSDRFDLHGFGSTEFLELTPGLGKYFGTDKGLLVVHAPKDANLKLEEGDVILDIDGRIPNNGSHALRILNSYRSGETLKLHIMRQQKRLELPIEMRADRLRAASLILPRFVRQNVLMVL